MVIVVYSPDIFQNELSLSSRAFPHNSFFFGGGGGIPPKLSPFGNCGVKRIYIVLHSLSRVRN